MFGESRPKPSVSPAIVVAPKGINVKHILILAFVFHLLISSKLGADEPCTINFLRQLPDGITWSQTRCGIQLSVEVDGPAFFQWQVKPPGAAQYSDLLGETRSTYTTPPISYSMNGTVYRVAVSNLCGAAVMSREMGLSVTGAGYYPIIVHWVGAFASNRIYLKFSEPIIPATTNSFSVTPARIVSRVITNTFDLSVMEVVLDESTPLEDGVDYDLRIQDIDSLPPISNWLSPEPTFIRVRWDGSEPLRFDGPLRLMPRFKRNICPTIHGCYDVYFDPGYLVWDGDEVLQYAENVDGPWIDLPDARQGHPMRQYFYDCVEREPLVQRFFRLKPDE